MKKLFFALFVFAMISSNAQITLEHTQSQFLDKVTLSLAGEKYVALNSGNMDTLYVYNPDYSIYRTIFLPAGFHYSGLSTYTSYIASVSDQLFNSDGSLEFVVRQDVIYYGCGSSMTEGLYSIMNESGQLIFSIPDTLENQPFVYKIGNDFKMGVTAFASSCTIMDKIYALPGTLPCNQCSLVSGFNEISGGAETMAVNAYPNPFNNNLAISYHLPYQQDGKITITNALGQEMASYPVNKQSDVLNINTSGYPKGALIINLFNKDKETIAKKVIKL